MFKFILISFSGEGDNIITFSMILCTAWIVLKCCGKNEILTCFSTCPFLFYFACAVQTCWFVMFCILVTFRRWNIGRDRSSAGSNTFLSCFLHGCVKILQDIFLFFPLFFWPNRLPSIGRITAKEKKNTWQKSSRHHPDYRTLLQTRPQFYPLDKNFPRDPPYCKLIQRIFTTLSFHLIVLKSKNDEVSCSWVDSFINVPAYEEINLSLRTSSLRKSTPW